MRTRDSEKVVESMGSRMRGKRKIEENGWKMGIESVIPVYRTVNDLY